MQVRHSSKTPLLTCLLEGKPGVGKTALAATGRHQQRLPLREGACASTYKATQTPPAVSFMPEEHHTSTLLTSITVCRCELWHDMSGLTAGDQRRELRGLERSAPSAAAIAKVFDDAYKVCARSCVL